MLPRPLAGAIACFLVIGLGCSSNDEPKAAAEAEAVDKQIQEFIQYGRVGSYVGGSGVHHLPNLGVPTRPILRIPGTPGTCSAFFLSKERFVTARHCLQSPSTSWKTVKTSSGEERWQLKCGPLGSVRISGCSLLQGSSLTSEPYFHLPNSAERTQIRSTLATSTPKTLVIAGWGLGNKPTSESRGGEVVVKAVSVSGTDELFEISGVNWACLADSGGPVLFESSGGWLAIGIIKEGWDNCPPQQHGEVRKTVVISLLRDDLENHLSSADYEFTP